MFYTVYRTKNTVNGKIYVGIHKTADPNDGYLGSGTLIRKAVKKYGREAFQKEVLFIFDNPEDMRAKEREIVTPAFVKRADTYNLMRGGDKGFGSMDPGKLREMSAKGLASSRKRYREDPEFRKKRDETSRRTILEAHSKRDDYRTFQGRTHSEETRAKMRGPRTSFAGSKNSQWGTAWICKEGQKPRKIPKQDLPSWLEQGWKRGRKL